MNFRPFQHVAWLFATIAATIVHAAPVSPATADKSDPAGVEFFEKKIRPVFSQQCYRCHSNTADKLKAGLFMDSREGLLKGGTIGPAIVPGHPEQSLLIEAIKYANKDLQMPPKNALPAAVVADVTKWVQMGAPFPGGAKFAAATTQPAAPGPGGPRNLSGAAYEQIKTSHWAWQPVKAVAMPAVKNTEWPRGEIDRLVLAKMESKNLRPVGDADKATLLRRVTFDLIGLPPTPEELTAFLGDTSQSAFETVVDRLLASPRFGERWGRHWLDIARYAESTGSSRNVPYTYAYRYRDYVIDSFNKDKPYDRFVTEQIAGDLLPYTSPAQHNEQMLGTGFLAMGVKDLNEKDHFKYEMDNVDEQIDVMGRSILATTIACARCHDHKFDPIPTHEYYSLAGIFKSSEIMAGLVTKKAGGKDYDAPNLLLHLDAGPASVPVATVAAIAPADPAKEAKAKDLNAKILQARTDLKELESDAAGKKAAKAGGQGNGPKRALKLEAAKKQEINTLEGELAALGTTSSAPAASTTAGGAGSPAMGIRDDARPADAKICIHGETDNLGPAVPRGVVGLFNIPQPTIPSNHSGRLELAQWLASPQNPLTARVMANRVWQHLFGEGVVTSVDNFGTTGSTPTNPELLDHLAGQFVKYGWSFKKLIRTVVMSRSYQLSAAYDPANAASDPGNVYGWRMSPRRLEAEAIRDAMLAASGKLDPTPLNGSPVAGLPVAIIGKGKRQGVDSSAESTHRSVYLPILRSLVPEALDVFDFAEPALVTGSRDVTTVPTQALYLMNNEFVIAQSKAIAARVLSDVKLDDPARIDLAYRLAFSRPATPTEKSHAVQFLNKYAAADGPTAKDPAKARQDAWASLCQAMFATAEFRYVR